MGNLSQTHYFYKSGLDTDTELRLVDPMDYRDAVNLRIGSSQSGSTGSAENIKGNIEIDNTYLADSNYKCIGWHEDKQNSRIFFFICDLDKARLNHGIYEYSNIDQTIRKIYAESRLNFHEHNLITATAYTNNQLFWADGVELSEPHVAGMEYMPGQKVSFSGDIYMAYKLTSSTPPGDDWVLSQNPNPPREINVQDAKAGMYDGKAFFDNVNFNMIKIPPFFPPAFTLFNTGAINYTNKNSFQSTVRFIYRDNQKSVFGPASELAVTGYSDKVSNKITWAIELPSDNSNHYIHSLVIKYIEFAVRDSVINPYKSIKTIKYPSPALATGSITSVTGTAVVGTGFSSLSAGSGLYTTLKGDVFIGTILTVNNDTSITLAAPYGSAYAGNINVITAKEINGKYYYAYCDFYNDENYPVIQELATEKSSDAVPLFLGSMAFSQGRIFTGKHIEDYDSLRGIEAIDELGEGSTMAKVPAISSSDGRFASQKILKPNSRYQIGLIAKDYAQRNNFVYTGENLKINTEEHVGNTYYANYLQNFTFDDSNLPDWVRYLTIGISENLTTEWFAQGRIESAYYGTKYDSDALPVFAGPANLYTDVVTDVFDYMTTTNTPSTSDIGVSNEIYLDISNWLKYQVNIPYNFKPGDLVNILTTGGENDVEPPIGYYKNLRIKKFDGRFLVTDIPQAAFYGVSLSDIDGEHILAVGENGLMYETYDGGSTWESISTGTSATLRGVSISKGYSTSSLAVGDGGAIVADQTVLTFSTVTNNLYSVDSKDSLEGWFACGDNILLHFNLAGTPFFNVVSGAPAKKLVSIKVSYKSGANTYRVVMVSEDGVYYNGSINTLTNTYTNATSPVVLSNVKFNKITTLRAGGNEYSYVGGMDYTANSGCVWAFKNGVQVILPQPIFDDANHPEVTSIGYSAANTRQALLTGDTAGNIHQKRSPDLLYDDFMSVFMPGATQFMSLVPVGTYGATLHDMSIIPLGGAGGDAVVVGDMTGAIIVDELYTAIATTDVASPILPLINYGAKIEIHRPRKASSNTFFYEGILSTGGYGGSDVDSRVMKRGEIPSSMNIGKVDEGDCFFIAKSFKGRLWGPVSDFVISMSPDAGNTTGAYVSADNVYTNEGWHKGNSRPNIVYDGVISRKKNLTAMRFSNNYIVNSPINGLCSFEGLNEKIFPIEYIALNKLGVVTDNQINGNVLLAIFAIETASIYIERTQYTDAGGVRQLGLTDQVIGSSNTLLGGYGTVNPESVCFQSSRAYFWDATKGSLVRYGNDGLTAITEIYKMRNKYKSFSKSIESHRGNPLQLAPSTYDLLNDEFICGTYSLSNEEINKTIAFSENSNRFTSYYDFGKHPEMYGKIGQSFVSFVNGVLWLHGENELYNNFYGDQKDSTIQIVSNENPGNVKIFKNIVVSATDKWSVPEFKSTLNSNNRSSYYSSLKLADFRFNYENECMYYADIQRASNTPNEITPGNINGVNMRGVYLLTTLKLDPAVTWLANLYYVNLEYTQPEPNVVRK